MRKDRRIRTRMYLSALIQARSHINSEVINYYGTTALASQIVKINGEKFYSKIEIDKRIANIKRYIKSWQLI